MHDPMYENEVKFYRTHICISDTVYTCTGKSLSEALLFSEHGENMLCTKIVLNVRNFCTQQVCGWNFHVLNCNSMKNLLSYCGVIDAKIVAFNKDLPVK